MKQLKTSILLSVASLSMIASPALANVDEYSVDGGSLATINLNLCSAETQLAVRGDTGTDLDFVVSDPAGNDVIRDEGIDDYLSLIIEKAANRCETYALQVSNLGEESNTIAVILEPVLEDSTRVEKRIIQANETQTIPFKACGTSAKVTARGDGDTDLDFVIRNADNAVVHEDDDTTDETVTTLPGLLSDCETFEMEVSNLGEVYNALMMVVEPQGAVGTPFPGTAPSTSLASMNSGGISSGGIRTVASSEGEGTYHANANSTITVNVPVCSASRMVVRGDGDTDLDFVVTNSKGTAVHSDADLSDVTFVSLSPSDSCETFSVEVSNLGDVYNEFTVSLTDVTDLPDVEGPGDYRVNAELATKVALRVCEVTSVRARGDGDTDLDFDVTDKDGNSVHSDYDMTDRTSFTLDPGNGCSDYQMSVSNLGDVYNMLSVTFGDAQRAGTGSSATTGKVKDTAANDRSISILNQTGETLTYIYWSNSAVLEWGEDKLGDNSTLAGGQQWNVNVNDGSNACLFDFKGVTASGREIELSRINACEVSSVTFE